MCSLVMIPRLSVTLGPGKFIQEERERERGREGTVALCICVYQERYVRTYVPYADSFRIDQRATINCV